LPEVGDKDKPKLVFFFDEAHLLFDKAPEALLEKIEQVVRLIRSKGVGIYFVTQSPADVPDSVLGQLGNRVQHALRAYTPKDQKAVRVAAQTFRPNPAFKTEEAITNLGVGEALVSVLDSKGIPGIVERVLISPPSSRIGPLLDEERDAVVARSPLGGRYDTPIDRQSAHELLTEKARRYTEEADAAKAKDESLKEQEKARKEAEKNQRHTTGNSRSGTRRSSSSSGGGRQRQSATEAFVKSTVRTIGNSLGRQIVRGLLGSIFKGR
jgi:DNA helicase HerA-like ATPase